MISVFQAKAAILKQVSSPNSVQLPLMQALGHVLASDVYASVNIPAFKQSSMDGYAIKFDERDRPLIVKGEMAAGTTENVVLSSGEAARIFTGAPLPLGADTVVMQEKVLVQSGKIVINDTTLILGSNARNAGSEVEFGKLAIAKGTHLTPAALGFLAGIGETKVAVYPMPKVSLILTGKELQSPGNPLGPGQVYESNSFSLRGALTQAGIENASIYMAEDDLLKLKSVLSSALAISDIVILSGGVSVGDYDFVVEAARLCDVTQVFHKVKQKPGKPLFFGVLGNKLIFGLPGNPSSVLSCFYQYVLPAIEAFSGRTSPDRLRSATLLQRYEKNTGLTHFVKALYKGGSVQVLGAQESFRMSSFASANCMICFDEERSLYKEGEIVNVYILPL